MTIIVTGGAGFIGSNFIFYMLDSYPEDRIVCMDKLTYAGNLSTLASAMDNPHFRFCKIDICGREAVYRLFEEIIKNTIMNILFIETSLDPNNGGIERVSYTNAITLEKKGCSCFFRKCQSS